MEAEDTVLGKPLTTKGQVHYFHVHLLKLTNPIDFQRELGSAIVAQENSASKILIQVTQARQALLELWSARKLREGMKFIDYLHGYLQHQTNSTTISFAR